MQELAKTIEDVPEHGHEYTLREAAKKWAAHCVNDYSGELLHRGLAVTAALAEFMNEYECASDAEREPRS